MLKKLTEKERQCIINQSKFQQSLRDYYKLFPPRNTVKSLNKAVMFKGNNEIWHDIYINDKWQGSVSGRNIQRYYPILVSTISSENTE
jgi:hypothetical protein